MLTRRAAYEIKVTEDIYTPDGTLRCSAGEVVDTVTTGADGTAESKPLYLGKYEITEMKAPDGMVVNKDAHTAELVYAGQEIEITETAASFCNDRQKARISLSKVLEQNKQFGIGMNNELSAVTFGVYAAEELTAADGSVIPADGLIEILSLDENGKAVLKSDVPFGSYYVKEISTDSHYILSDEKYPVTFAYAGQEIPVVELAVNDGKSITNEMIYGEIHGMKKDEDGKALARATIGLFLTEGTEPILTTVSAEDGSFSFTGIPYGEYVVREIAAPEGYVMDEAHYRSIIRKLDEKTGLNGAALPIAFNSYGWFLGHYRYVEPKAFGFNRKFFNDSTTGEAEVIDVIRHEYAHYYVDVAHLERYIGHSRRETSHGDDWKWACKMVGADPTRCHNNSDSISKKWSLTDAIAAYNADDVVEFDVLAYLNKWHQAPVDSETASKTLTRIKERNPYAYYEIGDEILHPKRGFGIVEDAIPHDYWTQKIYVRFEDKSDGVFDANDICKIVDGVAVIQVLCHEIYHRYQHYQVNLLQAIRDNSDTAKYANLLLLDTAGIYENESSNYISPDDSAISYYMYSSQRLERDAEKYSNASVVDYYEQICSYLESN
jgi:predicted SprT family Zn-dependent metalloprotease